MLLDRHARRPTIVTADPALLSILAASLKVLCLQTCPKMRYKIDFAPADLLCPKTLLWIPFDRIKPYLDSQGGRALCDAPGALTGLGTEAIPAHRRTHLSEAKVAKVTCSADACFLLPNNRISIYEEQD